MHNHGQMRSSPGSVDTTNIVSVCNAANGLDLGLLREMLGYFVDENWRRMRKAAAAIASDDRAGLREIAHAVRGSAAMIGAGRLHDLAGALERHALQSDHTALHVAADAMRVEFLAVHASLRQQHPDAVGDLHADN